MLVPVLVTQPRHLSPTAPACQPCPWPALLKAPDFNPYTHRFSAVDVQQAARRTAEVAQQHPTWPQSRVRALVARELSLATTQLRYLLRQAAGPGEAIAPAADAPSLAA